MNVFHLTTVHSRYDNRIFNKECKSLADKYDVFLIVADGKGHEYREKVNIIDSGKPINRLHRMIIKTFQAFNIARKEGADIYHIHDPELLITAFLYRIFGKNVVYDIHEDYKTSIQIKSYLPMLLRSVLSAFIAAFESIAYRTMNTVLAEKYYAERFPNSIALLNYPDSKSLLNIMSFSGQSNTLLYTGNVTVDRGAYNLKQLAEHSPNHIVKLVGKCDGRLAEKITTTEKGRLDNMNIIGVDNYVPFDRIVEEYTHGALAGLALFPENPHYTNKELTKFFEFMAVGLPIIASDFPVWRDLIEGNQIGFCVDPEDIGMIHDRVRWLKNNPEAALEMGRRGKRLIKTKFNWQMEAEKLFRLYDGISQQ